MDLCLIVVAQVTHTFRSPIAAAIRHILLVTTVLGPHFLKNFHHLTYIIMAHCHIILTLTPHTLSHRHIVMLIKYHMVMASSMAIVVGVQTMFAMGERRAT